MSFDLLSALMETQALRVASEGQVFLVYIRNGRSALHKYRKLIWWTGCSGGITRIYRCGKERSALCI